MTLNSNSLVMFAPGRSAGGADVLFAEVAQYWNAVTGEIPTVIDYPDGATATYLNDHGVEFMLREGQVHPVMLDENFIRNVRPGSFAAIGTYCHDDLEALKCWNRTTPWTGTLDTGEMLFVWTHPKTNSEHRADF
jgi:hypothetical protein